jgi:hypothetical protein
MIGAFASVGVKAFDVSITDLAGEKVSGGFKPSRGVDELRRTIGRTLQDGARDHHNVIIRPRSTTTKLIQLDDLDTGKAERIAPHAFIVIQTSPGNYQAWVAVEKEASEDFSRRLRKGAGADPTASGSTRIAGSLNFKSKYSPAFPQVDITHANAGNVTTAVALEHAGFVARAEEPRKPNQAPRRVSQSSGARGRWPNYEMCVRGAPLAHGEDRPDISRADFTWCRTAYQWGHSVENIAVRLLQLSEKARADGERYAQLTAENAARSVDRESQPPQSALRPA